MEENARFTFWITLWWPPIEWICIARMMCVTIVVLIRFY
jgi:hypothetical protein